MPAVTYPIPGGPQPAKKEITSEEQAFRQVLGLSPDAQEGVARLDKEIQGITSQLDELLAMQPLEPDPHTRRTLKSLGIDWRARSLETKLHVVAPIYQALATLEQQRRLIVAPNQAQIFEFKKLFSQWTANIEREKLRPIVEKIDPDDPGLDNWRREAWLAGAPNLNFTDLYKEPTRSTQDEMLDRTLKAVEDIGDMVNKNDLIPKEAKAGVASAAVRAVLGAIDTPQSLVDLGGALGGTRATTGEVFTQLNTHDSAAAEGNIAFKSGKELNEFFHNKSLEKFSQLIGRPFSFSETTSERALSDVERMSQVRVLEEDIKNHYLEWLRAEAWVYSNLIDKGGRAARVVLAQNPELSAFVTTGTAPLPPTTETDLEDLKKNYVQGE